MQKKIIPSKPVFYIINCHSFAKVSTWDGGRECRGPCGPHHEWVGEITWVHIIQQENIYNVLVNTVILGKD